MNGETIQIDVPKRELVAAFLEKVARVQLEQDIPLTDMQARTALLPGIGAPMDGGIYAGITVHMNLPMALVLLPGDESLTWSKAKDWAAKQGGALPSRMDALALWQNLPGEFKKEWYWTSEEYAGYADCAWIQYFDYGGQNGHLKSYDFRCRAVRRVAI